MGPQLNSLGKKEVDGKTSYGEIYWKFVEAMAERMNENKVKYGRHNYRKELEDRGELLQAALRHLIKIIEPSPEDTETKEQHLAACGCNLMMVLYQENFFENKT